MPGGHKAAPITEPEEALLWEIILNNQGTGFTTSGREKRPGNPFTYTIRGAEMFVDRRAKSITRATILFAYRKVQEIEADGGTVSGPKSIGVHGDSYIFAIFKELGIIKNSHETVKKDMDSLFTPAECHRNGPAEYSAPD